jgi:ABC-type transport system involved in multi-copper enzyme maturation permease subunit
MQFWALIVDSFRHTRDRKIFWVMIGISVLIAVAMSLISFDEKGISLLFRWHFEAPQYRAGTDDQRVFVASILTLHLIGNYIGFAGVILGLVSTAGILPDLMRPGAIDVVLAKPLSRAKLFLGKYLGSIGRTSGPFRFRSFCSATFMRSWRCLA